LWPVAVQGDGSAKQIANAIDKFNQLSDKTNIKKPDLLIVARGGGSLEDLWSFNEEIVVRSVFSSSIPVISAVGHETDTTLIDFVSDLRAPTPTGAAEKSVPVRDELLARISELKLRLNTSYTNKINNNKDQLNSLIKLLGKPDQIFNNKNQKLDFIYKDIESLFNAIFVENRNRVSQYAQRLTPPKILINNLDAKVKLLETKFINYLENIVSKKEAKLNSLNQLLEASSFNRVLERGFSLVMDNEGKPIKLSSEAPKNARVRIKFSDQIRSGQLDL
jgi:exodeoxyribonuclease VII large subunit